MGLETRVGQETPMTRVLSLAKKQENLSNLCREFLDANGALISPDDLKAIQSSDKEHIKRLLQDIKNIREEDSFMEKTLGDDGETDENILKASTNLQDIEEALEDLLK